MQDGFLSLIKNYETRLKRTTTISNGVGYVKLFLVLCMGVSLYVMISKGCTITSMVLCIVSFILLAVFWIYHIQLSKEISYCNGIISICERQLYRTDGTWMGFEDNGAEFIDPAHPYSSDLDIVGAKSIFQLLNSTHTWHGRQIFANDLLHSAYSNSAIEERQKAISELSEDIAFATKIEYHLSKIGVSSAAASLAEELKDKNLFLGSRVAKALLVYVPLFTFAFIVGVTVFEQAHLYLAAAIIVALQAIVWVIGMPKIKKYFDAIGSLPYKLNAYSAVIDVVIHREFDSQKLTQIKGQLQIAAQGMKALGKISDKVNARHQGILCALLNIFLLWDYECAFLLEDWKRSYADVAEQWFLSVGELESLLSFSHLPNACDNTSLPILAEDRTIIEALEMGHPLLPNESRVNNSLQLGDNIHIISGSNMSGKTTFLRTVGVNLILARAGSFVCAKRMICSPFSIMTSMRITDDLNEGVSTFYAELKRVKGILDFVSEKQTAFFLIDEMFRGTNSVDRLTGAKAVIARLNASGASGIISTHDLELCELAVIHKKIENYNFSEHYDENRICFDYKIKRGKSKTTNARYLMEMLGIT
jgi:DNA mismatch repair ATPase MutS